MLVLPCIDFFQFAGLTLECYRTRQLSSSSLLFYRTTVAAVSGHIGLGILCYSLNPPFFCKQQHILKRIDNGMARLRKRREWGSANGLKRRFEYVFATSLTVLAEGCNHNERPAYNSYVAGRCIRRGRWLPYLHGRAGCAASGEE